MNSVLHLPVIAQPVNSTMRMSPHASAIQGYFTENKGQWDPAIRFVARTPQGQIAVTDQGIIHQEFSSSLPSKPLSSQAFLKPDFDRILPSPFRFRQEFTPFPEGFAPLFDAQGELPHVHHYFLGNDPYRWTTHCRNFASLRLLDPHTREEIRLQFSPPGRQVLDSDPSSLLLSEESSHSPYLMAYSGYIGGSMSEESLIKNYLASDDSNHLYLSGSTQSKDFMIDDPGRIVEGFSGDSMAFILKIRPGGNQFDFITFLGGSGEDLGLGFKLNAQGNIVLSGITDSPDFPILHPFDGMENLPGELSLFFSILAPSGDQLLNSSYFGHSGRLLPTCLAMDSQGELYLQGLSIGGDFPYDTYLVEQAEEDEGYYETFLLQVDTLDFKMQKSVLLLNDELFGISMDVSSSGELAISGLTDSHDLVPVRPLPGGESSNKVTDAYIMVLEPGLEKISMCTYLGGSGLEYVSTVLWDSKQQLIIGGSSDSLDFPNYPGSDHSYEYVWADGMFSFVMKISWPEPGVVDSFFFGDDSVYTMLIDMFITSEGDIIATGQTEDFLFPAYFPIIDIDEEMLYMGACFILWLDGDNLEAKYSTLYGGSQSDIGFGIIEAGDGSIYIAGYTNSPDLDIATPIDSMKEYKGGGDMFLLKLIPAIEDENPPLIVLDIPDSPSYTAVPEFQLNGQITDEESSIARATINGDLLRLEPDGSFIHTLTLAEGSNLFLLEAWDSYQNKAEVSFELVYDPGKPVIELIKPNAGMVLVKSTVIVRFIVENKLSPIDRVTVSVNGELQHEIQGSQEEISGNQQSVELQLQKELNTILITASNQAGTSTELTFTYWLGVHRKVSLQIGSNKAQITIDDEVKEMTLDAPPIIINNRTMVPVRFIAEAFGAKVSWDASEQAIMIEFEDKLLTLWIGRDYAIMVYDEAGQRVNKILQLDSPPIIVGNRTMVPVRFITEALGAYEVQYEAVTRSIFIYIVTLR